VTNQSGAVHSSQTYCAYGRKRSGTTTFTCGSGNSLPTAPRGHPTFTGQKLDGTGLQYFNARYYDPQLGTFISPDTLVPDPGVVFDYNRYMYVRGNPMLFIDPSGHDSCIYEEGVDGEAGSIQCNANPIIGGQTETINVNAVTATEFGPHVPTLEEIAAQTARRIAERLKNLLLYYHEDGSIDWNATIGNSVLSDLTDCAKLAGGVCGFSLGGSVGLGGGLRGSLDFYVDQTGHWDSFGTIGGGGYLPPLALVSGGVGLAHIETGKLAVAVVHNAAIQDMRGWSGQVGFNLTAGHGLATEWLVGKNSAGEYWHGLSIGSAEGYAMDLHLTATYSWSGQAIADQTIRMMDQLRVTR
jgi:RHS repeat-associated protein